MVYYFQKKKKNWCIKILIKVLNIEWNLNSTLEYLISIRPQNIIGLIKIQMTSIDGRFK